MIILKFIPITLTTFQITEQVKHCEYFFIFLFLLVGCWGFIIFNLVKIINIYSIINIYIY